MGRKCRVWWPTHLSSNPSQSAFLFGWFVQSSSNLLDIVVSFASTEPQVSSIPSGLQEILHQTNGKMPLVLQDECMFAMLGYCQADLRSNSKLLRAGAKREKEIKSAHRNEYSKRGQKKLKQYESRCRGCHEIDNLLEQNTQASVGKQFWIQLIYESSEYIGRRIWWIPRLHHMHWNSQTVPDLDLYVIIYETPRYGSHHFLLGFYSSSGQVKTTLKKPIWVEDLHAKKTLPDLDTVILAINSAATAKLFFKKLVCPEVSTIRFRIVCMSESCVEYAEKAALQKHFMWSNVAVDLLFGNMLGIALLIHAEFVCIWISKFSIDITSHLLRMGCVSLMGNPAGFKLNSELAGVLGMISLNAIQIWSTIWSFLSFYFIYFVKGIAISGVLFGVTTPAAIIIDLISLTTTHVRSLHWGQKLNPLRQRLDSYDYTVDQHVVGSLLFTPVLLLLPTTSAFYIFFAVLGTTISIICIFIEVAISVIHATPYMKIFLLCCVPSTLYNFPSAMGTGLPLTLPWMSIPYKEYWQLCHDAVLACKAHCKCHLH